MVSGNKRPINLLDSEAQQWKSFNFDDVEYDFGHLDGCKHQSKKIKMDNKVN